MIGGRPESGPNFKATTFQDKNMYVVCSKVAEIREAFIAFIGSRMIDSRERNTQHVNHRSQRHQQIDKSFS
jgi:Uri superfamily endonuclease